MVVAFLILVLCNQIGSIALDENRYENPVFLLVVSICGWVLLYEVAQELKKKKLLADAIVCCGQNSMAIVVLHFLCFKIISLVGVVVYNQPREGIAAFPVLYEQGAWWDCVYVCGDYCSGAFKRDVEKIERETGEKIFSGGINGQKVAKRNRGSFNC